MLGNIEDFLLSDDSYSLVMTNKENEAKLELEKILKKYDCLDACKIKIYECGSYDPEDFLFIDGFWPNDCPTVIQVLYKGELLDLEKLLKQNNANIAEDHILVGAVWSGYMDYSGSYYAEELGYDNPESYDDPEEEYDVYTEWLERQAENLINRSVFVDVVIAKE